MATFPPESLAPSATAAASRSTVYAALEADWLALHRQGAALALMARIAPEPELPAGSLARLLEAARPSLINLLAQGLEDAAAMLDSGITALAVLSHRGQDTAAPALALWREFHAARAAMLALLDGGEPI